MSIDALSPMRDFDSMRVWDQPTGDAEFLDADAVLPVEQDEVQAQEAPKPFTHNAMHRWQDLLLESQTLVRDSEELSSNLSHDLSNSILTKYYDRQIRENNIRMVTVFALTLMSSAYKVQASGLAEGHPEKSGLLGRAEALSLISNTIGEYFNGSRTFNERTQQELQHKMTAMQRVADGHKSVYTDLSATQTRIDNEKARAQAAS